MAIVDVRAPTLDDAARKVDQAFRALRFPFCPARGWS